MTLFCSTRNFLLLTFFSLILHTASFAQAKDKIEVLLDWFVNPDHAPLVIAVTEGYFAREGLEVKLIPPSDPSAPPKLIASKQSDVAISYQPQLHLFADQKLPLKRFGTLIASPLNSLVVLKDSEIKSIKDLRDKKIGFSVGGFEEAVLSTMLGKYGLLLSDVTLVNVNFSLSPSLYTQDVDAVIGAFRNFELNQMEIHGKPGRAFFVEEEDVPIYDELIYIAHSHSLKNPIFRRKMLRFLAAIEVATLAIMNRPDELWNSFISYQDDLDNKLNRLAWNDTLPRFALRPAALDRQRYNRFDEFLKEKRITSDSHHIDNYAIVLTPNPPK